MLEECISFESTFDLHDSPNEIVEKYLDNLRK
jgi:hypothetical protein